MIIERLSREHRNIETLLAVLERELEIFDRGDHPDYEVVRAIVSYFELYPELYHHPQEELVFAKLKLRDPAAAARVGDLTLEHQKGTQRLRRVVQAIDGVLADREMLRQDVENIVRDFIESERRHIMIEDRDFFPAALPQQVMRIRCLAMLPKKSSTRYERASCRWRKSPKSNGIRSAFEAGSLTATLAATPVGQACCPILPDGDCYNLSSGAHSSVPFVTRSDDRCRPPATGLLPVRRLKAALVH
jgi:hemerythrin-like domain-containing protein